MASTESDRTASQESEGHKSQQANFWDIEGDEEIVDQLPSSLLSNGADKWLYDDSLTAWHTNRRGTDVPAPEKFAVGRNLTATSSNHVAMTFRADGSSEDLNVGSFIKPEPGESDRRFIRLDWIIHSQLPGLRFTIQRGSAYAPVRVWFYANTLRHQHNASEAPKRAEFFHDVRDDVHESMMNSMGLAPESRGTGTTWRTTLQVWSDAQVSSGRNPSSGLQAARPQVSGISQADVDRIVAVGTEALVKGDEKLLSCHEWVLWGFLCTNTFQVYRSWNKSEVGMNAYSFFTSYMDSHISNVLTWGNWPHYQRQAKRAGVQDLLALNYDLCKFEPPRNMVKIWRVKRKDGKIVAAQAEQWGAFPKLEIYPDIKAKAFGHRLSIDRGREPRRRALREELWQSEGFVTITFTSLKGSYYAELREEPEESICGDLRPDERPEPGLRIKVVITQEGPWSGVELAGTIQSDVMGSGAELNAILFAPSGAEAIPDQTSLLGTIKLTDNGLTQDRQICAIIEIASGLENKREYGVDIPHLVLGAKPYIDPSKSGSLYQSIRDTPEAEIAYKSTLHHWKLNRGAAL
jgi:hypothetical protein